MKTTPWITLGAMIGSSLIVSAKDKPQRPMRPDGPPPAMLEKFDTDKDGKLSEDERKAMRAAKEAKMKEHRKEMIAKFDKDGDGKLNDEEREKAKAERQAEMIKKFDTDGDGKLSEEERAKMPKPPMHRGGPDGKRGPGGVDGKRGPHGPGAPDGAEPKTP
jgi:hypothetical protein